MSSSRGLAADVRRMAPVWALVMLAATGTLFALRLRGAAYIRQDVFDSRDNCRMAEILYHAGMHSWRQLSRRVGEDQASRRAAGSPPGESSLARLKGDPELAKAGEQFERAAELCPGILGPHLALADLAWWEGNEARTHYHLGMEQAALGDLGLALAELQTAREMAPADSTITLAACETAIEANRWDIVDQAVAEAPAQVLETPAGWRVKGAAALHSGQDQEGIALLKKSLEAEPGTPAALRLVMNYYRGQGRHEEAADFAVENLAKSAIPTASNYHSAAMLYLDAAKYEKALGALDHALRLSPNAITLHYHRAVCLYRLGDYPGARKAAEMAMARDFKGYMALVAENQFNPAEKP